MDSAHSFVAEQEGRIDYKVAKAEHYLQLAEDCLRMARFGASRKFLEQALRFDPGSHLGESLRKQIEHQYSSFQRPHRLTQSVPGAFPGTSTRREEVLLIVDQDERVLTRLATMLHKFGFSVVSACSRQEALETLETVTPDLVVSEVNFEDGPSGLDLFLAMRSSPRTRRIPFLFLATRIDREVLIAGKRFGVDDFLQKPVDAEVVAASVMNCLFRTRRLIPD